MITMLTTVQASNGVQNAKMQAMKLLIVGKDSN